jgi:hypothetical protein
VRRGFSLLVALAALGALLAPAARAAFEFEAVGLGFTAADETPSMQAGSHPFAMENLLSVTTYEEGGGEFPSGEVRDLQIDLPDGFAGDPKATLRCSGADFADIIPQTKRPACADDTAVGVASIDVGLGLREHLVAPVYNLDPAPGTVAKLGFVVTTGGVPVTIDIGLSEKAPYHVVAKLTDVSQAVLFYSSRVKLWGNPASPVHDSERGRCAYESSATCATSGPERPFLTLPTSCTGPLTAIFHAVAWNSGAQAYDEAETPVGVSGCGELGFAPEATATPTSSSAESPSGLDFDLQVDDPGLTSAGGRSQSAIEKAVVTMPRGVTINPSQAEGLGVCTEAQLAAEKSSSAPGAGCPNASKIGTVKVKTPLLEGETLSGSLFVATPYQNPFHTLIALYMVFRDKDLGVLITQPLKVTPDPITGQLIATAEHLPQLPFSDFKLHFREGGRSPLVTPPACGSYATEATLYPYSGAGPVSSDSTFEIGSGPGGGPCPSGSPPFAPALEAGSLNNAAGSFSPFSMRITRRDGDQDIARLSAILPPGVTGRLAGVPRCSDAAIAAAKLKSGRAELAAPSCPAASLLGHVVAGAGVGSELTYARGFLYLAGPYGGDPLSVVAIVPAVAGPFDVGTVVTREALTLDPATAEVEVDGAASDPIPPILEGIPLKLRDLRVEVDRPGFTLNPTGCSESSTRATITGGGIDPFSSADDVPVAVSSRYQAASCASLGFKPKVGLKLRGSTRRNGHPALSTVITPRAGDANIGAATVVLPRSEFIDQDHINNPCTRVQFAAGACPPKSVLGTAKAWTPLLDEPLEGPVYFRSNGGERQLPDLVLDLHGLFDIVQVGFVDSRHARIRTRFPSVPDAPVSKIVVRLHGGKNGLLVNSTNLCRKKPKAKVTLLGHNGRRDASSRRIATTCRKKRKATRRKAAHRRR